MALEKFNWQNGTQIEPAKVEIGGQSYNVSDAQFEGETPLSAGNLNLMQDTLLANVKNDLSDNTKIPSVKAINDLITYSSTEQVVGTWLGKPLYRVVVETTTPNALNTWKEIYTGHNVNKIIKYGGHYSVFALPLNTNDRNFWFSVSSSNNIQMAIDASSDINKSITLWFEYTKTTD